MLATAPSVLYGIFRYLYLIYDRSDTRSTAAILTEDPGMIFAGVTWVGAARASPMPLRRSTEPMSGRASIDSAPRGSDADQPTSRRSATRFAPGSRTTIPGPSADGGDQAQFEFEREWQRKLHEAGWAGISWPKEYGGRGATLIEQAIFGEELARAEGAARRRTCSAW